MWAVRQQVYVVVFAVARDQLCFRVFADVGETMPQVLYGAFGAHVSPAFGDKDQVNVQGKNAMPAGAKFD